MNLERVILTELLKKKVKDYELSAASLYDREQPLAALVMQGVAIALGEVALCLTDLEGFGEYEEAA